MVQVSDARTTRRAFMTRTAGAFAAVSGAGTVLAACGAEKEGTATSQSAGSGSSTVQVINILPPQLGYTAEYIADMDGYFKKEGLTVKTNTARGSAPAIQAVLSGTALLSWVGWLESVIDIGTSQEEQFRQAQPTSVFLETDKFVTDGLAYITSQKGLSSSKAQIKAYLRALKGAMEQIPRRQELG